jgi:hypothetical protein
VAFEFSWRGAVVEIVRLVVSVSVRSESGVEVRRDPRMRFALFRLMGDSVARIVCLESE